MDPHTDYATKVIGDFAYGTERVKNSPFHNLKPCPQGAEQSGLNFEPIEITECDPISTGRPLSKHELLEIAVDSQLNFNDKLG